MQSRPHSKRHLHVGSIWGSHNHWWAEGRLHKLGWAELKLEWPTKCCGTQGWASFSRSIMFWETLSPWPAVTLSSAQMKDGPLSNTEALPFLRAANRHLHPAFRKSGPQLQSFWPYHLFTIMSQREPPPPQTRTHSSSQRFLVWILWE